MLDYYTTWPCIRDCCHCTLNCFSCITRSWIIKVMKTETFFGKINFHFGITFMSKRTTTTQQRKKISIRELFCMKRANERNFKSLIISVPGFFLFSVLAFWHTTSKGLFVVQELNTVKKAAWNTESFISSFSFLCQTGSLKGFLMQTELERI